MSLKLFGMPVAPCPFCASEDIRTDRNCIECANCGATGPDDRQGSFLVRFKELRDAIRAWNFRRKTWQSTWEDASIEKPN